MAGLFRSDPEKYAKLIDAWLDSTAMDERLAGVIAAGASGEAGFVEKLKRDTWLKKKISPWLTG